MKKYSFIWILVMYYLGVFGGLQIAYHEYERPSQYEIDHPLYYHIDGPIDLEKTKQMVSDGIEAFDELWNQGE